MSKAGPSILFIVAMTALGGLAAQATAQRSETRSTIERIRDSELYRRNAPRDVTFRSADGTITGALRCGTAPLTIDEQERIETRARQRLVSPISTAAIGNKNTGNNNTIAVWVHVVHHRKKGQVSDEDIDEQIRVLNRAFRKHDIDFELAGVTRTNKKKWFQGCGGWNNYKRMTNKLAVDPAQNLNIYTCDPDGVLGFVWDLPDEDGITGTNQDGVVILHSTLPNGTAAPYDEGDTATHEVGHWAGLYHTFQNGCSNPGDRVDDTAPESSPAYGCPKGRDSCSGGGADPIRNFMDYVDDACMRKFTPGQGDRMRDQIAAFRSGV